MALTRKLMVSLSVAATAAMALAVAVGIVMERDNRFEIAEHADAMAGQAVAFFRERLQNYEHGLRGARGAVAAVGLHDISRSKFRAYMESRDLFGEFPGAHGFGLIRRVPRSEAAAFVAATQRDGRPDFTIRTLGPNDGDLFVVQYLEPEAVNVRALGLDIASEPVRRQAAVDAARSDAATLSAPVPLVQRESTKVDGLVFLLPIYGKGSPPPQLDDRLADTFGWIYTPLILREVIGPFDQRFPNGAVAVVDAAQADGMQYAYKSAGFNPADAGLPVTRRRVEAYGRAFFVDVQPQKGFYDELHLFRPVFAAAEVFALELILICAVFLFLQNRHRAIEAHIGHAQLGAIVESSNDAIIGKRIDGTVMSWNRAAEEMFGYSRHEAIGRSLASLVVPPDLLEEEIRILGRIALGERIPHFDTTRRRKDGTTVQVSVTVSPIRDEKGVVIGASKTVRDVTRQKAAEAEIHKLNATLEAEVAERTRELNVALEAAQQASRSKADFLANMSHEIRSPMNAVLGLAYLAEQQPLDPTSRDLIRKITGAGRSLLGIINDILDFSKIEEGRLDLEDAPFSLLDVLDNVSTIMSAAAGEKRLELIISPPPPGAQYLRGDALRLGQVLINLTGNAIKFTEKGHVLLSVTQASATGSDVVLRFSVQDTGIGIPKDKQGALFAPFTQADVSTTRRFGGTGLGLAISRQLVTMMGGEIGLVSGEGMGSEFWFTAKFARDEGAGAWVPDELRDLKVLMADDNALALNALKVTAEHLGWHGAAVGDGPTAIETAVSRNDGGDPFDVVVLDWQMPDVDGLEVVRSLRRKLPDEKMPVVIMVTAHSRERLVEADDSDLADGMLTKPVTASTLYDAVGAALRSRGKLGGAEETRHGSAIGPRLTGIRILVVDDSDINRELAARIFGSEGAVVTVADDGVTAVRLIGADPYAWDIVLMDVQMPVMDGLEATRRIRALPGATGLPVVALTAGAFTSQRDAALAVGMNAVVTKPYNVDTTVALIRQLTGRGDPAIPTATPIPQIEDDGSYPGIDLRYGIEIWKDIDAYKKYLRRFAKDYGDFIRQLDGQTSQELARRAHKLKGASASLGLNTISVCAGLLDQRITMGDATGREITALRDAIDISLASIAAYAGEAEPGAPGPAVAATPAAIAGAAGRLMAALDSDDPDRIAAPLDDFRQLVSAAKAVMLCDLIDRFEFRKAETELSRLVGELGLSVAVQEPAVPAIASEEV